jgi:hypothetical protein
MQANSTDTPYHSQPDEAFWPAPYPVNASEIEIVTTQPPADAFDDAPKYSGRFKKGDPRIHRCSKACTHPRHRFTSEECSRGFWAAIESIVSRHPNAIMADGRHIACNFLKSRKRNAEAF